MVALGGVGGARLTKKKKKKKKAKNLALFQTQSAVWESPTNEA
jgi:hypothetical protein